MAAVRKDQRYKMGEARFNSILVVGGGAWGTALAAVAARNGVDTTLWAREAEVVEAVNTTQENSHFLPGVPLPENTQRHR